MATAPGIRRAAGLIHPHVTVLLELFHLLSSFLVDQLDETRRHATLSHQLEVFSKLPLPLLERHRLVDNAERRHGNLGHLKGKQLAHQREVRRQLLVRRLPEKPNQSITALTILTDRLGREDDRLLENARRSVARARRAAAAKVGLFYIFH